MKKFNSDDPDGFDYYLHNLRQEKRILTRSSSGMSVMIWVWFSLTGRASIAFSQPKMNLTDTQNLMWEHLLPLWLHSVYNHTIFQQDYNKIDK